MRATSTTTTTTTQLLVQKVGLGSKRRGGFLLCGEWRGVPSASLWLSGVYHGCFLCVYIIDVYGRGSGGLRWI